MKLNLSIIILFIFTSCSSNGWTERIKLELISKQYPESTDSITKEFDITNTTQKVDLRARGRQAKVRVSCAANNASWKWGSIRLALQGDGGR